MSRCRCRLFAGASACFAAFLDSLASEKPDEDLVHRNTKGVEYCKPVRQVHTRLVMHFVYHLGQIVATVWEAGGKPAATDCVVYARQLQKD